MLTASSKHIRLVVLCGVAVVVLLSTALGQALKIPSEKDKLLREISAPLPIYPKSAWREAPNGSVTLIFDVTENGLVENPCVVGSTLPGIFELYALHALKAHRYEHIDGPAQHIGKVRKRIEFSLTSNPTVPIKPKYPRQALESGTEGYVVVEFGVSEWGAIRHLIVAEAKPTEFFEAAAIDAANLFRFPSQRFTDDDRILHKFSFSLDSKPLNLVIAEYPDEAKKNKIEGHVIVEFDINSEGKVEHAKAIFTSASELGPAAVEAVRQYTFTPEHAAERVLHKIEFNLDQNYRPLTKEQPEYPRQALLDGVEGYVVLKFDINEKGLVESVSVEAAKPQEVFNESALTAAAKFTYEPRYVDGKPTRVNNVLNKIIYRITNEESGSPRAATPVDPTEYARQRPMRTRTLKPTYKLFFNGTLADGSVIVEFDVNKQGYVEDPEIVEVIDTDIPEELKQRILEDVSYFRYSPLEITETRMNVDDVLHLIDLRFRED